MRKLIIAGVVFCAVASLLGRSTLMLGAVANAAVPYAAVPFAVGFLSPAAPGSGPAWPGR